MLWQHCFLERSHVVNQMHDASLKLHDGLLNSDEAQKKKY